MAKEIITWVRPNGSAISLSDETKYEVLLGTRGFYMPPISFVEDEVPLQHGSRVRKVRVKPRDIDVPLAIRGADETELRNNERILLRALNPLKGDGKLKVTSYDGSIRELQCRYSGGLEIEENSDTVWNHGKKAIVIFHAADPFWYGVETQVKTFNPGQPATFFPFFPLRITSSSVFADTSIDNEGDIEAWPEWIITGPGENIVLRNLTTGEVTNLGTTSLETDESITINTKEYEKTITKNDGTNLYGEQTDESSLWALQDGINNIRIEMANTSNSSSVQLTYRNRYWGP